jgi:uncharacterized protein with HEPN domain
MSSRSWRERVQDILDAIAEIQGFTNGLDFVTFRDDLKTIRAVEMNFIVIGEAAAAIPDEIQEQYPIIPWHLMRGMRNRLVHAYFMVDRQIMWETVQHDLPPLVNQLEQLL